eukprot:CAMPEP_0115851054 /NCGR_PEP_ID=MMETSP0287-20121206/12281_1 /TAXON_ID=412157 /ORGANISM="Chrysochromulina rotalis, Strain UIO044" /LENGTH=201 /DNA_ID=CAMNT_0003305069 /DNA_START=33 /DNA_END=638 /DNA_ORIENTATION=-
MSAPTKHDPSFARMESATSYMLEFGEANGVPVFNSIEQLKAFAEAEEADKATKSLHGNTLGVTTSCNDPAESWSMAYNGKVVQFWNTTKESIAVMPRAAISYIAVMDCDFVEELTTSVKDSATWWHKLLNASAACMCHSSPCFNDRCCMPEVQYKKISAQVKASEISFYAGGSQPAKTFFLLDRHLHVLQGLLLDPQNQSS